MTTDERKPTPDEAMGMAWWNSLSEESRTKWATKAGTGVVADAWAAFKADSDLRSNVTAVQGSGYANVWTIQDATGSIVARMTVNGNAEAWASRIETALNGQGPVADAALKSWKPISQAVPGANMQRFLTAAKDGNGYHYEVLCFWADGSWSDTGENDIDADEMPELYQIIAPPV